MRKLKKGNVIDPENFVCVKPMGLFLTWIYLKLHWIKRQIIIEKIVYLKMCKMNKRKYKYC